MALTPVYSGPDIPKILIFVFYEHQINGQGIRDPIIDSLPSINWQIQLAVHAILYFHQMTTLSIPSPQQTKIKEGVDKNSLYKFQCCDKCGDWGRVYRQKVRVTVLYE